MYERRPTGADYSYDDDYYDETTAIERHDPEFSQLSLPVQRQIIEKLIESKRLAPVESGSVPMLRFHAEGVFETGEGRMIRRVTIETRTYKDGKPKLHTSRFVIYSTGVVDLRV